MNKIILIGRLTRDPEICYSRGEKPMPIARYSIAVDKRQKREDGITADFFQLVAFDRHAVFAEKYLRKGIKIAVIGHVQTGSYNNKDGIRVPFFEVVIDEQEFAESKNAGQAGDFHAENAQGGYLLDGDGFMSIPEDSEALPFD